MSWGDMDFTRDLMASLPEHMRPKGVLHPHEARQKADPLRRKLFADWHRLQDIVLAHEETIQRRWKKRTAVKRKQVLLEVNPTLPKEHAPEISALSERGPAARQERRNDFLLPYLNLEDLSINNGTQCGSIGDEHFVDSP
ncbi:hypothetical protein C8R46DRAFT_1092926 [Mycena filopes]|nr:hypothetical protein C8R46DRAFT_1092925 [Mycena filopes]KAJ7168955.1 hypothetical protein C8R46DRAFT_1092926 [Mycena filopes]